MASRSRLISVTCYDRDGGLDWSVDGSNWPEWLETQRRYGFTDEQIRYDVLRKFEAALDFALTLGNPFFAPAMSKKFE